VNALNSAMQAYFTLGREMHLRAARNGFEMLVTTQSFATGGWGPDEQLREPNTGALAASLVDQHQSFETPCGAYAHFKLTRSLLRVTREASYGDSMERVMYNTVLGARPLQPDGTAFYYSDYSYQGHKGYSRHRWPCCSGTLPQVAADYRISAYFHDANDLYLNLYVPSTLSWKNPNARGSLTLSGEYPFAEVVQLDLKSDRPSAFGINLRIPSWTNGASISVNGKRQAMQLKPGSFANLNRQWKTGDRVELHLPMTTRLEAHRPAASRYRRADVWDARSLPSYQHRTVSYSRSTPRSQTRGTQELASTNNSSFANADSLHRKSLTRRTRPTST
jgi:DUF1680 family protein